MKLATIFAAVGLALFSTLTSASATGTQLLRTFVSPTGDDSNNCSIVAPCRHFQAALTQTLAGGEIAVLGTAGYNNGATVTIDKAISIVNPGGYEAGIFVPSGGNGILITAGANDAVSLRGLTIEGGGTGTTGIQFNSGASLTVENCIIRHMMNDGINVYTTSGSTKLLVSNSLVADNRYYGIFVFPSPSSTSSVSAIFNRVEVTNNYYGNIVLEGDQTTGTVQGIVSDSVVAWSVDGYGLQTATNSTLTVFHSVIANNALGIETEGTGASISLSQSTVTGNHAGWQGSVLSYGNNSVDGNATNQSAPPSVALK